MSIVACGINEEAGPENITKRYFAAIKNGDIDGNCSAAS
jgi:hypothetical protein